MASPPPPPEPQDNYNNLTPEQIAAQRAAEQERYRQEVEEQRRLRHAHNRVVVGRQRTVVQKFLASLWYLVGALELLLGLRFFLRLTAANPENIFADVIYSISEPFVAPFSTLFVSPAAAEGRVIFDVNIIVAMLAYLLLTFLVIRLVTLLTDVEG